MQEFKRVSKADRYLPMSSIFELRAHRSTEFASAQKPQIRAIVETDEAGGKVIRLSDGFPRSRSSYGRIAVTRAST